MPLPDAGTIIRESDFEITPTGTGRKIPLTGTIDGKIHSGFLTLSETTGTAASGTAVGFSLVTGTGVRVIVTVKGNISWSGDNFGTVILTYAGVEKDRISFQQSGVSGGSWSLPFYLHYTETPGNNTGTVTATISGGTIENFKYIVHKI